MKLHHSEILKATPETEGRFQLIRYEAFEPHLFDENAAEEQAHCGRDTTRTERIGEREYLNDRLNGNRPRAASMASAKLAMIVSLLCSNHCTVVNWCMSQLNPAP